MFFPNPLKFCPILYLVAIERAVEPGSLRPRVLRNAVERRTEAIAQATEPVDGTVFALLVVTDANQ